MFPMILDQDEQATSDNKSR